MNCRAGLENWAVFLDMIWNSFSRSVCGILKTSAGRIAPEAQKSVLSAASVHSLYFSIKWQVRVMSSRFKKLLVQENY